MLVARTKVLTIRPSSRKTSVIRSSKSPQKLNEMMQEAIDAANKACVDPLVTDTECLVLWDVVNDIDKAYNKAMDEVLSEDVKNVKPTKEYFLIPNDYKVTNKKYKAQ